MVHLHPSTLTTTSAAAVMPFFRDEEVQLAGPRRAEPREQPLLRDCVPHEVDIAIEVEPERGRATLSHRRDRCQISLFPAANKRHRGAVTWRLGDADLDVGHQESLESNPVAPRQVHVAEEHAYVRSVLSSVVEQSLDQNPRITPAPMRGVSEH